MAFIREKIKLTADKLLAQSRRHIGDVGTVEVVPSGYKKGHIPPAEGWTVLESGTLLGGKDAHFWLRARFDTPAVSAGKRLLLAATTGREGKWDATNPQGLLYLNGKMVQGFDTNHTEAFLEPETHYEMLEYFYCGMVPDRSECRFRLLELDTEIEGLYYDIRVPLDVYSLLNPEDEKAAAMLSVLERTVNLIDMREIGSEDYARSIREAREFLRRELYENPMLCSREGKPVIHCVGHTHIDVEWQWTRDQTREKIQRSFATAAALMKEYPEYRFMLSQPELYRYLKEETPEKYAELKELVAAGRWEPEGAMWVEADCNLVSGESFIRQIMQGTKFFRDEFGKECRVLFLPDVFGYSAALPQILRKSGIRHFVTSKISWNDTNSLPFDEFLWEGIDGTEIFTSFLTAQNYSLQGDRRTTYNANINATQMKGAWNRWHPKEYTDRVLATFGFGDGGGGPTREMLEMQRRLAKGLPGMPVTEIGFMLPHLDRLREEFDDGCRRTGRTPRWVGELYLEFHRGTYTSIAKNKRGNRKAEFLLGKAESLSYAHSLFGGDYDSSGLWHHRNLVLHDQFHDIIPGSSIHEVYELTDRDYAAVTAYGNGIVSAKLADIAARVRSGGGTLVYNPLGFAARGLIRTAAGMAETDAEIPSHGWRVCRPVCAGEKIALGEQTAENDFFRLTLDRAGRITSLWDKRAEREVFRAGCTGNEIQAFEDYPRVYDNWEISDYYKQKMWVLDGEAEITPIRDGCRAGFRVVKKYLHSVIEQKIWLYAARPRIDFENEIDWHEQHQLLKAAFPLDVHTMSAAYEIQFGHVTRATHENTSWDQAKFEVWGHKWVDLSENGYGVALLNDCKYGYNTEGSTLKITMLRSGTFPDTSADQGHHTFTYSLMPHIGDFREAGVIREAYALNQPMESIEAAPNPAGALPASFSLAGCGSENIVIETVKRAEDENDAARGSMIVRLYDAFDRRGTVTVRVAPGMFREAYLCDLMEHEEKKLDFDGECVRIPVGNFEIVTLKFVR